MSQAALTKTLHLAAGLVFWASGLACTQKNNPETVTTAGGTMCGFSVRLQGLEVRLGFEAFGSSRGFGVRLI